MRRPLATAALLVLLAACVAPAQEPALPPELREKLGAMRGITAEQAQELEEKLKTKPDDREAREKLIRYYFLARLDSGTPAAAENREKHILWLIEHHPQSDLAGSPEASIEPWGNAGSTEGYQRGKQLWLQHAQNHPGNAQILCNAAQYLQFGDSKISRELLEKAVAVAPGDWQASSLLAQSYLLARIQARSPEERKALAQKAFAIRERALGYAEGELRFYAINDAAKEAFEAGETAKAAQYASELLESAPRNKGNWAYGNAIFTGNSVLGRIALQRGDVSAAKQYLLATGETPGSPQLDTFGPDMTLAQELLDKGEREAVINFLQSCGKFWMMGKEELQSWISTIRAGGKPDFSRNLSR